MTQTCAVKGSVVIGAWRCRLRAFSAAAGNGMPARAPHRRRGCVTVCAASASRGHSSSSRPVIIDEVKCELLGNEGGKYSLVGEMVVDSDPDSMYNMLTDYAASPRVFSTVDSVETGTLEDGRLLVSQTCRWKFMVFGGAFPCQLAVKEDPESRYMEVVLHQQGFIREFEGSWKVTVEPTGGVRVRHTLALRPALTPPYAHKIFLRQIGEILEDVQKEVESWQGGSYPATAEKDAAAAAASCSASRESADEQVLMGVPLSR